MTTTFRDWLFDFWGCNENAAPHKHLLDQFKNELSLVAEAIFEIGYTRELLHALFFNHRSKLFEPSIDSPVFLFKIDIQSVYNRITPYYRQIIEGLFAGEELADIGRRLGELNINRRMDHVLDNLARLLGESDVTEIS